MTQLLSKAGREKHMTDRRLPGDVRMIASKG
jgi:hypothetical protein